MTEHLEQQLGNYRLVKLLGRGGFADTYLGKHIYLEKLAAIKVLQAHLQQQDEQSNFLQEARTIGRLEHPHIVQVRDFGVDHDQNTPYLVMDYAPNGTLRQRHRKGIPIPITTVVPYVKQVAEALHYAHNQNVIHRDVKPENMLLGANNEVLLSDFGIAVMAQSTYSQNAQNVAGTIAYMAPEQFQGKARPASDQYALAVVVYEWLCGAVPFRGSFTEVALQQERALPTPLRQHVPTISADVEQVVLTAMSKDPRNRFGNILAFANALEQASRVTSVSPSQETREVLPTEQAGRPNVTPVLPLIAEQGNNTPLVLRQGSHGSPVYPPYVPEASTPTPPFFPNTPQINGSNGSKLGNTGQTRTVVSPLEQPQQTHLLTTTNKVLLGVIALLLILISSGVIYYTGVYHPNQVRVDATSTVIGQATGTVQAQKNATAIVVAQATNAAVATTTASQNLYTQATSGTPVISDSLSTADNYGWEHYSDQDGACNFEGGAYHVRVEGKAYNPCMASGIHVANFAMQVEMTMVSGDFVGITFRSPFGENNINLGYVLFIGKDGTYGVYKEANGGGLTKIIAGIKPFIHTQLNQTNVLTLIAKGTNFSIYLNKQFVVSCNDSTYSSGAAGLVAGSVNNGAEAIFRNLQIWQL